MSGRVWSHAFPQVFLRKCGCNSDCGCLDHKRRKVAGRKATQSVSQPALSQSIRPARQADRPVESESKQDHSQSVPSSHSLVLLTGPPFSSQVCPALPSQRESSHSPSASRRPSAFFVARLAGHSTLPTPHSSTRIQHQKETRSLSPTLLSVANSPHRLRIPLFRFVSKHLSTFSPPL